MLMMEKVICYDFREQKHFWLTSRYQHIIFLCVFQLELYYVLLQITMALSDMFTVKLLYFISSHG